MSRGPSRPARKNARPKTPDPVMARPAPLPGAGMIRPHIIRSGWKWKKTSRGCPTGIPFFIPNRLLLHITEPVCEPPTVTSSTFPASEAPSGKVPPREKRHGNCRAERSRCPSSPEGWERAAPEKKILGALPQYTHTESPSGLPQGPETKKAPASLQVP